MTQSFETILVAVDGSPEAEQAFYKAVNVAKRNQAKLILTHIIDTRAFQSTSAFDGALADDTTRMAQDSLNALAKEAEAHGLSNIESIVEYGIPKKAIAKDLPLKYNVDLIIIGATGLNTVERLLIGSVSEYVIRHAKCDVLVARTNMDK